MRGLLLPTLLLALPLAEIAGFVVVGRQIGVFATIALVILTGIAGSLLLRYQGFGAMARISRDMREGRDPSRELAHGVMILVAGILLVIPGFVSDIVGLLLFIPPVRDLGWRFLRKRVTFSAGMTDFRGGFRSGGGRTIDLDAEDFSSGPAERPRRPGIADRN